MTPNQIAVQLAEPSGRQFDVPFREMIKDKLDYWAERMIRNTIDKDWRRRKQFLGSFQPLILDMQPIKNVETGYPGTYKNWAESEVTIPAPMFANGINFDYVGSADGTTPFIYAANPTFDRFGSHDKYIGSLLRYSYLANKIQVSRNSEIPKVRVDYIPGNLRAYLKVLAACSCKQGGNCNWDDIDYPLAGDVLQLVMVSIGQEIAKPALEPREEVKIDAK